MRALKHISGDIRTQIRALADAISVSPLWSDMPRATLVVRTAPEPLLGVIGYFDAAGRVRLESLRRQLERIPPRMHYVSYAQAEKDCECLAEKLLESFGRNELRDFRFVAIPRGGFIVLGMLAYILGLRRSQLEPPYSPEGPLVVVDDCAISGVRFGQFLDHFDNPHVIFAHLYSTPELREAIEGKESRRVSCVAAHDLRDHAPEHLGEEYSAWRKRWMDRVTPHGYWVGQPEQVCFAWNEPDYGFWNPVTEREESGWCFVPPEFCLKNRPVHGKKPISVQLQAEGNGPLKPSSNVLFGELDGKIAIGNLETEESFLLEDVGADMWQAIVEYGNLERAAGALLKRYEVDDSTMRTDLREFAESLFSQGLLVNDV